MADMLPKSSRPLCRLNALCTLDGLEALTPALVRQALKDAHAGVRRHAVRLCEGRFREAPALGDALLALVEDAEPQVRLQLAYTLGRQAFADHPDCDAVYIGGGSWIAEPVAVQLEAEFGKPVICNQAAVIRDVMKRLGDWTPIAGHSRVLATA